MTAPLLSRIWSFLGHRKSKLIPAVLRNSARRKFSRRERGNLVVFTTTAGFDLECRIGDPLANVAYFEGEFEPELRLFLQKLQPAPATFVDVGCNIGYVSCLLAAIFPKTRILALDANPEMVRRCAANLRLNGRTARTICCAAGSATETRTFHIPRDRPSYASFGTLDYESDPIEVPVRRLDDLLREQGLPSVDLLKMDVEGFEPEALAGLGSLRVKNICFEYSPSNLRNCGFAPGDLWQLPLWKNYRLLFLERGTGRPLPFQPGDVLPNATETAWATLI